MSARSSASLLETDPLRARLYDDWCLPLRWTPPILSEARVRNIAVRGFDFGEGGELCVVRAESLLERIQTRKSIVWIRQREGLAGLVTTVVFANEGRSWGFWTTQLGCDRPEDPAWRTLLLETLVLSSRKNPEVTDRDPVTLALVERI